MNSKKLLVYLIIPVGVSLALNAMYFSGNIVLQRIVVPNLPPLPIQDWREFGLIESLQHLLLLGMVCVAVAGVCRKKWGVERLAFAWVALASLFVLLEEVDYGTTFYEYATTPRACGWFTPRSEWSPDLIARMPNEASFSLHNRLDLTDLLKHVGDGLLALAFGVLPLVALRAKRPWLQYIAPDRWAVLALAAVLALRTMTHQLGHWEMNLIKQAQETGTPILREIGAVSKNLSEFRELNIYYLFLVHLATVVFLRHSPAEGAAEGALGPSRG